MNIDIRNRKLLIAGATTGLLAAGFIGLRLKRQLNKPRSGPYTPETLPKDAYDAVIVGAGKATDQLIVQSHFKNIMSLLRWQLLFVLTRCCALFVQ